jgi:hypothetical protein
MDTDLFQILTLILLLGLLLTMFGVLQSLGAIRRALEGRGTTEAAPAATASSPQPEPEPRPQPEPEPEPQVSTWSAAGETQGAGVAADEPEPARTGWPAPHEAATEPTPTVEDRAEPAASTSQAPSGARVLYGDTGLTTAIPSEAAVRPAETEPEPEPEPATTETSATTGGAADDPQEQPFERDGRWWFRRGDELLVYEEQSGQWVAAGESAGGGAGAAAGAAATGGDATTAGAGTETAAGGGATPAEGQVTTQQEAVGSFWKCPSCGAVNGSTATSCRMCFTARP